MSLDCSATARVRGIRLVVQSALFFAWLTWWVYRLPDAEVYSIRAPWRWLMRMGQVAFLAIGFSGVRVIGIPEFNGLSQLQSLLAG